ncbi:MAG: hypothetical protein ACXVKA_16295 [Acidimicrobiia bacterium]
MSRVFRIEVLIGLVVLGYVVGLPFLLWGIRDARTISRRVWATVGRHRSRWEQQMTVGYLLGGWPAIPLVLSWRHGRLRHELRRERAVERERGRY